MAQLELDTRMEQATCVITLRGDLDMVGAAALDAEVDRALRGSGVEAIVVDLSGLQFIDSSGLRTVVLADRRAAAARVRFALVRGGEPVQRVFDLTRMTERLTWVTSPAELADGGEVA